jgi:hypothetical protein
MNLGAMSGLPGTLIATEPRTAPMVRFVSIAGVKPFYSAAFCQSGVYL